MHGKGHQGKTTMVYTEPQQRRKEKNERLRGEGDMIKLTYLGFERGRVSDQGKEKQDQSFLELHIFLLNDDL